MVVLAYMVLECTPDVPRDGIAHDNPGVDIILSAMPLLSGLRVGGGDIVSGCRLFNELDDVMQFLRTLSSQIALWKGREDG